MTDLRALAAQHIDYTEIEYGQGDWGPQFFCDRCNLTLDGTWSDMDPAEWDEPHNTYRQMAQHWETTHQQAVPA